MSTLRLDGDISSRILSLLLEAIGKSDALPARAVGMPECSVSLHDARLIVACTPCSAPFFQERLVECTRQTGHDIVLVRHGLAPEILNPVTVDVALRTSSGPLELNEMVLFRDPENGLWLVPNRMGPFVKLRHDGLHLEMIAPFLTWDERSEGIGLAAREIARLSLRRWGR